MGGVFVRSYFPTGYQEWVNKTEIAKKDDMSPETYDLYVVQSKPMILQIADEYKTAESSLRSNLEQFVEDCPDKEKSRERIVYDTVVGHKLCEFWSHVIDQPRDKINQYFKDQKPSVEEIFQWAEGEYQLRDRVCPAETIIATYKHYT